MTPWKSPLPLRCAPLPAACFLTALVLASALCGGARAATLDITGPAGAAVFLDGAALGFFPLSGPVNTTTGRHDLRCEMPGYEVFRQELALEADGDELRVIVRMTPLSRRTAVGSNLLLAGLGQHYLGHSWRGYFYNAAEIGGLLTALGGAIQRSNYRQDYLLLRDRYAQAVNADEIADLRAATEKAYSDMEDMESLRDLGLAVAGGAVVLSMLDAWLSFPSVTVGAGVTPAATTANAETSAPAVHAGLSLDF